MKNLVRRIVIETVEVEEGYTSPCQINGYYELRPEDQIALEELSPEFWEQFIGDCLQADRLDSWLAEIFS